MKYSIKQSSVFRRELKKMLKQNKDVSFLENVVNMLANGEALPEKHHDHELSGKFKGFRECHIQPDWLLIYQIWEEEVILYLMRTGSHSDLFKL